MADPPGNLPPLPPGYTVRTPNNPPSDGKTMPPLPPGYNVRTQSDPTSTEPTFATKPQARDTGDKQRDFNMDLVTEAVGSAPGSFVNQIGQALEGAYGMVRHPIDTATNLGNLLTSLSPTHWVTKKLHDVLGSSGDERDQKIQNFFKDVDAPKDALVDDYVKTYGGKQEFLKTLATDPFRIVSDFATLMSGGELGLTKIPGIAQKIGATGKVLEAAEKIGEFGQKAGNIARQIDPVSIASRAPENVAKGVGHVLDMTTGTGEGAMAQAAKQGFFGGEPNQIFQQAKRGELSMKDVVDMAEASLEKMRQKMFADYRANERLWKGTGQKLSFSKIDQEATAIAGDISRPGMTPGTSRYSAENQAKIQKLLDVVDNWQRDPTLHTIEGLDDLKRRLRSEVNFKGDHDDVVRAATRLTSSVRDTINTSAPPAYKNAMKNYQRMSEEIDHVKDAFSIGGRDTNYQTAMSKLQSVFRNNANTGYGFRKEVFRDMPEIQKVEAALAGQQLSSTWPRGIGRGVGAGSLGVLGTMAAGVPFSWPALLAGAAGYGVTMPRLVGSAVHGAASLGRPVGSLSRFMPQTAKDVLGAAAQGHGTLPWLQAGRIMNREGAEPFDYPQVLHARGGRIGYADGGEVSADDVPPMPVQRAQVNSWMQAAPKAVRFQTPQMQMPQLMAPPMVPQSTAKAPPTMTEQLGQFAKEYQEKFDKQSEKKAEDDLKTKLAELQALRAGVPGGGAPASGSAPDRSVVSYDPTFGLPESKPLPGSYEERVRAAESGGKDVATSVAGASGRYQFMPATAQGIIAAHPEAGISANWRTNAEDQEKLMRFYTDQSREILRKQLGRDPTGGELYTLHLFGHGGGPRVLSQLDKPIKEITTDAERAANPFLNSFATGRDLLNHFNRRFGGA